MIVSLSRDVTIPRLRRVPWNAKGTRSSSVVAPIYSMCTRYLGRVCSLSSHLVPCLMESDIRRVVGVCPFPSSRYVHLPRLKRFITFRVLPYSLVELPSVHLYVGVGNTDLIFFPSSFFILPTYTDRMEHIKRGDNHKCTRRRRI